MKKLKSFITTSDIKSFIIGLAIAIIISFGVTGVLATTANQGEGGGTTVAPKDIKKFIGQEGGLVNKIGSLTIGSNTTDAWILDPANHCLTTRGGENEKQSCLSVHGLPAASFAKLTVLDMPAFIQGSSLFLSVSANQNILAGLPTGLVIDDFAGTDDSIMVSSLQYEIDGQLAPRNLDEQRRLCANPTTGRLVVCDEPSYHWQTGPWSDCSAGGSGTCSGTWTTTTNGSCSGDIDPFCDGIGGLCDGNNNNYCSFDMDEQECLDPNGNGNEYSCIWYSCSDISHLGSVECNQANECYWNDGINYCNQGSNSSDDCLGISDLCTWHNGTSTTHYCSDKNGTSQSECEAYNSACSWTNGGESTRTRTVVCKDASGNTVADSLCTGDKPATSQQCSNIGSGNNGNTNS